MKYIHFFNDDTEFDNYVSTQYEEPFLSVCEGDLDYNIYKTNRFGYVDMGLPSGIIWATCNIGADSPTEYGQYFAWGETYTKGSYSWNNYIWGTQNNLIKYSGDGKYTLDLEDDAAHVNMGGRWRMPTSTDFWELYNNSTQEVVTVDGVSCWQFTSNENGNTLLFPIAGYYSDRQCAAGTELLMWLRDRSVGSNDYFACFFKYNPEENGQDSFSRYTGMPVRGVIGNTRVYVD